MLRVLAASLALALAGCHLAHERVPGADADLPLDAARADAASVDAYVRPCRWQPGAPWQVTSPPGDQSLLDLAALPGGGFLVAWGSSNDPAPDPARHVRRIGLDGPLGDVVDVFDRPRGAFLGGMGLAVGPGRILASTWDDAGCLVRVLDPSGVPAAPAQPLALRSCVGVHATAEGFAIFDAPGDAPAALHSLALDGAALSTGPTLDVLEGAFWWGRTRFDDGSSLVVGMQSGVEPTRASAQRIAADGAPLSAPVPLPGFVAASRVRVTAAGVGALVAWLEQPDGEPTSQDRIVRVVPVTPSGVPTGASQVVAEHAYRDAGLSLAVARDGSVIAVYVESLERFGLETVLSAVRLDASGTPLERFVLARGETARSPVARAGDDGIAIAFTAPGPGARQVFVTSLVCD